MFKQILVAAIGGVVTFLILKIVTTKKEKTSDFGIQFKQLIKTPEARDLVQTDEFISLIQTPEFKKIAKTTAKDYVNEMLKAAV